MNLTMLILAVVRLGSGSSEDYEDEGTEDIMREIRIADTGVCPHCGCPLFSVKDKAGCGLRCPKCGWSMSLFGVGSR